MSTQAIRLSMAQIDAMELVIPTEKTNLEGWIPDLAKDEDVREALEKAFNYRGDVTLTLKNGEKLEAYIFDRVAGPTLAESVVHYYMASSPNKLKLSYADIARLEFTGKDRAAGKQWDDWIKKYTERKAAGDKNIALEPEALD